MAMARFQKASAGRNLLNVSISWLCAWQSSSSRLNHEGLELAERRIDANEHTVDGYESAHVHQDISESGVEDQSVDRLAEPRRPEKGKDDE